MILVILNFTEDIKEENTHIFMQIFVIEKQFGEKCQILTVYWIFIAINFKNCNFVFNVSIDLISWGMIKGTTF